MRKHSLRLVFALLSVVFLTACASQREAREKTGEPKSGFSIWKYLDRHQKAWLFSYFTGDGDGLHLAYSYDGLIWRPLNQGRPLLKPEVGQARLLRDPSILQGPDGTFHMVWTTGWTEKGIGYASSQDLIHWSEQREIPVMAHEPEARNTWAPELFYNKGTYYIVWASTIPGRFPVNGTAEDGYNHRLYYTKTKDFKTFTPTALFYDPDFNVIDACFIKEGSKYYMFLKNETLEPVEKNIRMVVSGKLEKFPASVSDPLTGQDWAEGPTAVKIGKYTYLYWDKYRNHRYGAMRTKKLGKPQWEDISDMVRFPADMRHGTAFQVDASVLKNIQRLTDPREE
ncbi:MAG: glycoside hydrolase family 43 protein [Bacteroidales bacterium]|nr:glycoside hydrolase family 43 protein [Bacteroidales bacterium]